MIFTYDSNGALTKDSNRGIKGITYDYGHHPSYINMNQGVKPRSIANDYTPDGQKLSSRHVMFIQNEYGNTKKTTTDLYVDGLMIRKNRGRFWVILGDPLYWGFISSIHSFCVFLQPELDHSEPTPIFAKKYPSLKDDFITFKKELADAPFQGSDLGNGTRKVRMAVASKGKGKSGGAPFFLMTRRRVGAAARHLDFAIMQYVA